MKPADTMVMRGDWDSATSGATGAAIGEEESDCDALQPWGPLAMGWKYRRTGLGPVDVG